MEEKEKVKVKKPEKMLALSKSQNQIKTVEWTSPNF